MKIGIVLPNVPAYSETFFNSYIKGLKSKGYEVILFVNSNKGEFNGFEVVPAPSLSGNIISSFVNGCYCFITSVLFHFPVLYRLYILDKNDNVSIFRRIKNVIINSHFFSYKLDWLHFGYGALVVNRENVAEAIGAKMAVSFRGYDHYFFPLKNKNCYQLLFTKQTKYHVLSNAMKEDLLKNKIESKNIEVITPAIDINLFKKSDFIFDDSNVIITTVSRLHEVKGIDYILKALEILQNSKVNFHFNIIGDGAQKEYLFDIVTKLKLTNQVTFKGKLKPHEVKNELEKTNIYLQYSNQEGFCNAVLEAQATGLLCVVSDADGLKENVIDNQTGWVVPKKEPELLAKKIIEVINLPNNDKELIRNNASQRIMNQFNLNQQLDKFIKFYES